MPIPFALKPNFPVARKMMFMIPNAMSIQVVIEISVLFNHNFILLLNKSGSHLDNRLSFDSAFRQSPHHTEMNNVTLSGVEVLSTFYFFLPVAKYIKFPNSIKQTTSTCTTLCGAIPAAALSLCPTSVSYSAAPFNPPRNPVSCLD